MTGPAMRKTRGAMDNTFFDDGGSSESAAGSGSAGLGSEPETEEVAGPELDLGEEQWVDSASVPSSPGSPRVVSSKKVEGGGGGDGSGMDTTKLVELHLTAKEIDGAQFAWKTLIAQAPSREAAGEAIYAALFDSSPALQSLFVTPRAVQALRFMNGLNTFILALTDPPELKKNVETLAFGHLNLEVTVPRAMVFRDALVDLFSVELGAKLTTEAVQGLTLLLNYVGGALIFTKANYAGRLRILADSWAIATDKSANADKFASLENVEEAHEDKKDLNLSGEKGESGGKSSSMVQNVPTTYNEMFLFNAAVMGFGTSIWMNEVLSVFDSIVVNVANSGRLQEECCVLVLRIAKVTNAKVNLGEYKSCMLASLRSLLPKDWTTEHEVAWSWLWENVETLLLLNMGKTLAWERAVGALIDSIDEATGYQIRSDIYSKFFVASPIGEGYFKQSNTYLHIIATKIIQMTIDIYRDPIKMVDFVSGLGLRHVGYGIPTDLFGPFVSVCVEVVQALGAATDAVEGFRWALALVAKMLVRTILEGSTIVMKAINNNSVKTLQKAISCAPRGERAMWMLMIKVGTQDISPLVWSIQSGALESTQAMLQDLLTIRADRDKYYYGACELFQRHPDLVKKFFDDAPGLLPTLFDGLIWRSRLTVNGLRRVNYYMKYLLLNPEGEFAKTMEWIVRAKDPKIVCHPVLTVLGDIVWSRLASRAFFLKKLWFIFTLVVFCSCQSIIKSFRGNTYAGETEAEAVRDIQAAFRIFVYVFSMGQMIIYHIRRSCKSYIQGDGKSIMRLWGCLPVPRYLHNWQEAGNFVLMCCLLVMLCFEPILHCIQETPLFTTECEEAEKWHFFPYSVFSMMSMILYYVLLVDMASFNNRVSAYVLVCGRMLAELILFLVGLASLVLTASCAFSCLHFEAGDFQTIWSGTLAFFEMVVGVYSVEGWKELHANGVQVTGCYVFVVMSVIFLVNLLIAQLTCAYDVVYNDMVGFARLKRVRIIIDSMPQVSPMRWRTFVDSLQLTAAIEFNEGDIGVAGGIQVTESASAHPTTIDSIRRYGGSTSPSNQWPEESLGDDDSDRFERIETLIKKVSEELLKKAAGSSKKGRSGNSSSGHNNSMGHSGSGSGGSGAGSGLEAEGEEVHEDA
eukprot:TRINITY_DN2187_c0_g1_i4.p1 TRINITY_DN2187_c0_g1~~TRINITY_DN2187_c0_g1_i4.p1  ORF type:complete len:1140 (+),score=240.24 TRINITY_DN2187_c0_g1_i4:69-3488(+)